MVKKEEKKSVDMEKGSEVGYLNCIFIKKKRGKGMQKRILERTNKKKAPNFPPLFSLQLGN